MTAISHVWQKVGRIFTTNTEDSESFELEKALVENAKTNETAFGQLYEQHYSAILHYIYHRTLNKTIAEELTSNTFFNALNALPRYKHQAPFRAWLYRIALNELRLYFRKEQRRKIIEETFLCKEKLEQSSVFGVDVDKQEKQSEQFEQLFQEISKLPNRYQEVITFRYFENLSYIEISQILNKRIGTVKSLIHRGLKRLRQKIEKQNATFL